MPSPLYRQTRLILCIWASTWTVGCGSASGDVVSGDRFVLVDPADDPIDGIPAGAEPCSVLAANVEAGALELSTVECPWVTAAAPAKVRVREGDTLELFVFHSALTAQDPAEATVLVATDTDILWSQTLPVPSPTGFYSVEIQAPSRINTGENIYFHAHNHGSNTYTLGHLRLP
ncbi:MAG: hypothetical protein AB8H79_20700 [Myxococcota bacterium]